MKNTISQENSDVRVDKYLHILVDLALIFDELIVGLHLKIFLIFDVINQWLSIAAHSIRFSLFRFLKYFLLSFAHEASFQAKRVSCTWPLLLFELLLYLGHLIHLQNEGPWILPRWRSIKRAATAYIRKVKMSTTIYYHDK